MKNQFLSKLHNQEKIKLVETSDPMMESYLKKSSDCFESAKLLLENELLENSITMSYYAMYNALMALFFKFGIKCENHNASILILKLGFENYELYTLISHAKKERIDKQYYVTDKAVETTKENAMQLLMDAEEFQISIKLLIRNSTFQNIEEIKEKILSLL